MHAANSTQAMIPARLMNLMCTAPSNPTLLTPPSAQLQPQTFFHVPPDNFLVIDSPFPPHPRCIHVRWALIIRLRKHTHHAYQNLLHALDRRPALRCFLVVVWVVARRVQDRYADFTVGINCTDRLAFRSKTCKSG